MREFMDRILNVDIPDPDDARRRRLLNILLLGIFISSLTGIMLIIVDLLSMRAYNPVDIQNISITAISMMAGTAFIYWLNRVSGRWAAFLFLLLLTIVFSFSDTPTELADGRSLFVFTVPITISSLVLFPAASFIFAGISDLIIIWLANFASIIPNYPAVAGFFMLALVSWLAAQSLERALKDLRQINLNLDQLVAQKTQELASALSRELALAGRNKAVLESIADGVIVLDVNGNPIQANRAISNLLDLQVETITDINVKDLMRLSSLDAVNRQVLTNILINPGKQLASHRVEWGQKTLSVSSAQVHDSLGEIIGTVAVFRDFTREAEVERMKSRFVAMISHELRTPLNAILGFSEMLKEAVYGPVNEKQVKASERIMSNSQRLLGMVGELLDQAQIEAGKLKISEVMFKPADLLENLHGVMDHISAEKGLSLTSEIEPGLPQSLEGDPQRLQQILINLVNNAIKFTEKGNIHVRLFPIGRRAWGLEVRDTGYGIPQEDLPHIFDAFRQVDNTTTREHGGFGLGLSIVKQLINLMSGEIHVESKLGSGSTFTITLPIKQVEAERIR